MLEILYSAGGSLLKTESQTGDVETGGKGPAAQEEEQTTIIFTIHQPSSLVYNFFKDVVFLGKGVIAYYGPADKVVAVLEKKLNVKCPEHYNAAEFVLDAIQDKFSDSTEGEGGGKAGPTPSPDPWSRAIARERGVFLEYIRVLV